MADSKKVVSDDDILALLGDEANQTADLWSLLDLQVHTTCAHNCALVSAVLFASAPRLF